MSNVIPESWQQANLEDLIIRMSNGANVDQLTEITNLPISRIETIWNGNIDPTRVKYIGQQDQEFIEKYCLNKNDILFSHINSDDHIGKTAIYKGIPEQLIHGINLLLIRVHDSIDADFINYQFKHLKNQGAFIAVAQRAVNQSSINQQKLKNFVFNIPPFKEQKRVVQKIEELFSEIDDGVKSLEIAKKQLDIYRKAILIRAFNGNLTKQWRTLNSDKLPTEEYFLSAINRDREERYEKQVADWNKDLSHWEKAGKIGSKPKKPKPLPRIEATQISTEGLPKGWIKTNLEYVCDFITKGTTPAKNELFAKQGDIPFIKVYNLTHKGYLDFSIDPTFVTKQTHEGFLKRSKVYPNDVLMNIVGPPLGKVSIVPDSYPEWNINQAIAIYRSNLIDSKYLSEFLLNENTVRAMMSQSKATAGQFNLTLEICRNFPIPVCSKLEQAEIVKSLSENLSNAQYLQETIDQQLEQLTRLKQTILQKAFSGELVPQDPNDEPASVLLERIKAEKEEELAQTKANKIPKKSTKRKTKTIKEDEPAQQELI